MNTLPLRRAKNKVKYYYSKVMYFFGFCPWCWSFIVRTRNGKPVCRNQCKY
ncbi:MAG TPA: hypothetical protein VHO03_16785 [Ignavibacteriales bacterium]|nr:hypothetical protein [Ignavibacteriales bacterium]